jgi:hypothetical protein
MTLVRVLSKHSSMNYVNYYRTEYNTCLYIYLWYRSIVMYWSTPRKTETGRPQTSCVDNIRRAMNERNIQDELRQDTEWGRKSVEVGQRREMLCNRLNDDDDDNDDDGADVLNLVRLLVYYALPWRCIDILYISVLIRVFNSSICIFMPIASLSYKTS